MSKSARAILFILGLGLLYGCQNASAPNSQPSMAAGDGSSVVGNTVEEQFSHFMTSMNGAISETSTIEDLRALGFVPAKSGDHYMGLLDDEKAMMHVVHARDREEFVRLFVIFREGQLVKIDSMLVAKDKALLDKLTDMARDIHIARSVDTFRTILEETGLTAIKGIALKDFEEKIKEGGLFISVDVNKVKHSYRRIVEMTGIRYQLKDAQLIP